MSKTDPGSTYSTPRWVKVFGVIVIGLILLVIVVLLVATALGLHTPGGPGGHGPGRDKPTQIPLSSVIEDDALSGSGLADDTPRSRLTEHGV